MRAESCTKDAMADGEKDATKTSQTKKPRDKRVDEKAEDRKQVARFG